MILNEFFNLPQVFEKDMAEDTGQDSKSWMASIRQQHPDVKFIQAKMPGAPIIALVNGKPVAQFDTKKDVEEGTEETPFGSVSHNDTPVKPQQYHYGTEPSDKEIRKQRLLNVRQRKQDLLRDYAQMGALRVELIHGINNDVFLTKDQLLDYFDHLVDDPELTPLEYAHENGIPTDGLLKGMLRRAAQLGVSALDVRKLFASAKAKQGVAEGIFNSKPNPVLPIVAKIDRVARELTPQNVETGKQIIQSHTRDITRMLNPQDRAGVDVIEQGVAEGVRTESAELAKQYGWAYNQGEYGASMTHPKHGRISLSSPVTSRSGDTAVEREWTHNNASGIGDRSLAQHLQSLKEQGVAEDGPVTIGSRLPKSDIETFGLEPGRGYKINNPKDWKQGDRPRAVQQLIPTQDKKDHIRSRLGKHVDPVLPEAKDDYVPPREANYDDKYQAMVRRVGQKAKQQEKAKQQQPKAPVRESRLALLKQIIQS